MKKQIIIDGETYEVWKRSEIRKIKFSSFEEGKSEERIRGHIGYVNGVGILDETIYKDGGKEIL